MATGRLARNIEAYEPDPNPTDVDPEALRERGWPQVLVETVKRHRERDAVSDFELGVGGKLPTEHE